MVRKSDFWIGAAFFLFCLVILISSFSIKAIARISIGPDFMPKAISIIGMIVSAVLMRSSIVEFKSAGNDPDTHEAIENEQPRQKFSSETIKVFMLMVAFALLLQTVGYLITTSVYLILHFLVVSNKEQRKPLLFVVISIFFTVATYYLFRDFFGVLLPAGILG